MPRRVVVRNEAARVTHVTPVAVHDEGTPEANAAGGITITCLINNMQPLYLQMTEDQEVASLTAAAFPDIQHRKRLNGKVEVECLFMTPSVCTKLRAGRLVIDDKHVVELGPLQQKPVQCATLLEEVPTRFRLEVQVVETEAIHPSEALLVRHTLALLENDEFLGSISSSHLQNQVRDLPFYQDVIGPIRKNWTEFIRAHTDEWDVFKYTAEEIDEKKLGNTCRSKEFRVVARHLLEDYKEGDLARERAKVSAERELHDLLMDKLRERPYEQSELLSHLVQERSFLAIITPNLSKLLDYFESYPDRYFVLRDRLHPILVEAKRQGVVDDPRLDLWDNTPTPKYSFECPDYEG